MINQVLPGVVLVVGLIMFLVGNMKKILANYKIARAKELSTTELQTKLINQVINCVKSARRRSCRHGP